METVKIQARAKIDDWARTSFNVADNKKLSEIRSLFTQEEIRSLFTQEMLIDKQKSDRMPALEEPCHSTYA